MGLFCCVCLVIVCLVICTFSSVVLIMCTHCGFGVGMLVIMLGNCVVVLIYDLLFCCDVC